jgi:Trk K+ transport system NAD-binding subunit
MPVPAEETLSMVIPIAIGSPLENSTRNQIESTFQVKVFAVLKPITGHVIRDVGTIVTYGSALEVVGKPEKVIELYRTARKTE